MAVVKMAISLPTWVYVEIGLGKTSNKSERIQELIIKGYMAEKGVAIPKKIENNDQMGILTSQLIFEGGVRALA